jgi:hypothetical protein
MMVCTAKYWPRNNDFGALVKSHFSFWLKPRSDKWLRYPLVEVVVAQPNL